ncbi:MAG: DUF2339 domain-containing protein, partial [Erythrobacter sp.]|nr:DUF2339 domain-containing protein [Erythrobacter sp.]
MEWLFILGLGAGLWALHKRVRTLEARLRGFEEQGLAPVAATAMPEFTRPPQPVAEPPPAEPEPEPLPIAEPEPIPAMAKDEPAAESLAEPLPAPITVPEPLPEPLPQPEPLSPPSPPRPAFDFEDMFGRKLPIWAGGIALAVAGVYLVMYSIEQGLLTPPVRVAMSFVFGLLLLAGAELAYRFEHKLADPRVRQALAGAGIATLYAAFYLAGAMYGLIGPAFAFGGLAVVTALALGLAFRFGLPSAVLGLVGGFATPMMVASEQANVPVLAFYLALLTAALSVTARRLGLRWLGAAALVGGFGWGVLMLIAQPGGVTDWLAVGLYLLALGAAVPILASGSHGLPFTRLASGALAALQMAALVNLAGYDLLTWGLYLLLSAALAVLSWKAEELKPAGALVAAVGLILLALWPDPGQRDFAIVAAPFALVVLGTPLLRLWRDRADLVDLAQLCLAAPALGYVTYWQLGSGDPDLFEPGLAAVMAALAATVALAAWKLWHGERMQAWLAAPLASAALPGWAMLSLMLPYWAEVTGAVAVALVLAELRRRRATLPLRLLAWAGAGATLFTLLATGMIDAEMSMLVGYRYEKPDLLHALVRWGEAALPFLALAWLERAHRSARLAEMLLALLIYGLCAQFVPSAWLAWTVAALALACLGWQPQARGFWAMLLFLAVLWAVEPLGSWAMEGLTGLTGEPVLANRLFGWQVDLRRVLPLALAFGVAAWRMRAGAGAVKRATGLAWIAGIAATVLLHVLYKQLFFIADYDAFNALGLAERTLWQGLLVGSGLLLARLAPQRVPGWLPTTLAVLGLAHFAVFSFALHNPLWDWQAVGPWPLANLLLPAYAIAGLAVYWLAGRLPDSLRTMLRPTRDGVLMLLAAMFALSTLRHAFAGTVLIDPPLTQTEDLLRSLLGIVLALAYLAWGSRTGQRSWRIGSLVLMLLAVLKVFLVDAAGLEGLLRVA